MSDFADQEYLNDPSTGTVGDCWRACIASVIGCPIAEVPHFVRDHGDDGWFEATNAWLAAQGVEQVSDLAEAVRNPIVYAEVERAVNAANDLVSRAESIRKFEIVPEPFTEENGLLTASMKARRQAVIDHFGELIDTRIYAPKGR